MDADDVWGEPFTVADPAAKAAAPGGGCCSSSSPMSSKCDRSAKTASGAPRDEERKDDDLDDLELVRSGGEPGGCSTLVMSAWRRPAAAQRSGAGRIVVSERRRETFCSVSGAGANPGPCRCRRSGSDREGV